MPANTKSSQSFFLVIIVTLFFPMIGVALELGCHREVAICFIAGFIPFLNHIYAFYVIFKHRYGDDFLDAPRRSTTASEVSGFRDEPDHGSKAPHQTLFTPASVDPACNMLTSTHVEEPVNADSAVQHNESNASTGETTTTTSGDPPKYDTKN